MIGVIMGCIAFALDYIVKELSLLRWFILNLTIRSGIGIGWFTTTLVSSFFVLISSSMVMLVAPSCIGSGVAEAMGILNGVNVPDYIGFR